MAPLCISKAFMQGSSHLIPSLSEKVRHSHEREGQAYERHCLELRFKRGCIRMWWH